MAKAQPWCSPCRIDEERLVVRAGQRRLIDLPEIVEGQIHHHRIDASKRNPSTYHGEVDIGRGGLDAGIQVRRPRLQAVESRREALGRTDAEAEHEGIADMQDTPSHVLALDWVRGKIDRGYDVDVRAIDRRAG